MHLKYFVVKTKDLYLSSDRRAFVLISEKLGLLYNGEQGWSMRRRCEHGESSVEAHYLVELHQR